MFRQCFRQVLSKSKVWKLSTASAPEKPRFLWTYLQIWIIILCWLKDMSIMPFFCLFHSHRWTGASSQQRFRYFIDYGNGGWTVRCGAFHWPRLRRGEVLKNKQISETKLQGRATGRDRVNLLGFGPVTHLPPEHCHSCTLHSEMVTKSNSNSCVCLDAVSSSTYIRNVHMGDECFQFAHVLVSSHVTLQWLINTQLKWQLECFLHLFDRVFVSFFFFKRYVCYVCLYVYSLLWVDILFVDWPPAFSRVQSRNLNSPFTGHITIPLQDLSLPAISSWSTCGFRGMVHQHPV